MPPAAVGSPPVSIPALYPATFPQVLVEQRKAALRRVELELDEADDLVRARATFVYQFRC